MPKAIAGGPVEIPGVAGNIVTNVAPDPFDARDLIYRPRLQLLDDAVDRRKDASVLMQDGNSCTGHAVATIINTALAQKAGAAAVSRVSPYMLYYLARRYDEFPGDEDSGSSLRGVLKGWWHHGVALESEWPELETHFDLDDETLVTSCRKRPLGAYYRVEAHRLDDMQSAISELHAIVASARIHDGWLSPEESQVNGRSMFIIKKKEGSQPIGGHAFALVGYNDVGFLVQNSWGTTWGKGGFATLPYEDWLETAYDAWVARPGVPQTPFEGSQRSVAAGAAGTSAAPPLDVIRRHVLNVGNEGRLSTNGQATSSPLQLQEMIKGMRAAHQKWGSRDTVIYIHGGLNSESSGLAQVNEQYQWWLNNRIYPLFIVWQSGAFETLIDQLQDQLKSPFGFGEGAFEALDRAAERVCANVIPFGWSQMKDNAQKACAPLNGIPANPADWFKVPGASLLLQLLKQYAATDGPFRLHVLGHSAGAVYTNALLPRLKEYGLPVESLSLLAAACRVDEFERVLPLIGTHVKRFTNFTMSDALELEDSVQPVYHKSLLYLVSRGFERPTNREVPLVGMQHFAGTRLGNGKTLDQAIGGAASTVISGKSRPAGIHDDSWSSAQSHPSFHNEPATMTAVLLRILGRRDVNAEAQRYQSRAPVMAAPLAGVRPASSPVVGGPIVADGVITVASEEPQETAKLSAKKPTRPQQKRIEKEK